MLFMQSYESICKRVPVDEVPLEAIPEADNM